MDTQQNLIIYEALPAMWQMANVIRNERSVLNGKHRSATMLSTFSGSQDMQKISAIEISRRLVFLARRCSLDRTFDNCVVAVLLKVLVRSLMHNRVYTTDTIVIGTKYWINIENIE